MSIAKSDYESIAQVIAKEFAAVPEHSSTYYAQRDTIRRVAKSLAMDFAKSNSRFLPHVFITNCKFTGE